jgi:hypothetical protein
MPGGRDLIYLDEPADHDPFAAKAPRRRRTRSSISSPKDVASVAFMLDHRGDQVRPIGPGCHAAMTRSRPASRWPSLLGVLYDLSISSCRFRSGGRSSSTSARDNLEVLAGMDKATTAWITPQFDRETNQYGNLMMLSRRRIAPACDLHVDPLASTQPNDPGRNSCGSSPIRPARARSSATTAGVASAADSR